MDVRSLSPLRCALVGADSLLVECGEILVAAGHTIVSVATDASAIAAWAAKNGIATIRPAEMVDALSGASLDYLFAITHLGVLSDEVLKLPSRAAINFHDGPLPRYAGLNAPAWALLNGETRYGITWHVATSAIDGGDVLAQRFFDVAADETSLTLNTRCFEAAIETFTELIGELASDGCRPWAQDGKARTYFAKHDRPAGGALLDWRRPAKELSAMVRGLNFGRYVNPLGAAKAIIDGEVYVVVEATVEALVESASGALSGMVVEVDENAIRVACGAGSALSLRRMATLDGREVSVRQIAARHGLSRGWRFAAPDGDLLERLTASGAALGRSEAFWVRRLAELEPLELPYAPPVDENASSAVSSVDRELVAVEVTVPQTFHGKYAVRLADALTAAAAVYVARLCSKDQIAFAFRDNTLRNRAAALWPIVAPIVPARVDIDATADFSATLAAMDKELASIRKRMPPLRDVVGRYPALRERTELLGTLATVAIEQCDRIDAIDSAMLARCGGSTLNFIVGAAGDVQLCFDRQRMTATGARAVAEQFATFLQRIADNEDAPLSSMPLVSDADLRRMTIDWNATESDYPRDRCIHELIEAQAVQTPESVALVFEGQSITYAEVNARANQLARHLQSLGVGPERLVGICLERSASLAIAALAVFKAGGAYVPLDPAYPHDRLAMMVDDASLDVIVCEQNTAEVIDAPRATKVRLDAEGAAIAAQPTGNLPRSATPENLAYVIYTSGSTGKPKGVMVEHRNAVNFFAGMDQRVEHQPVAGKQFTWLAVTSLSFDISVLELFWTLARGFKVVIYRDRDRETPGVQRQLAPAATRSTSQAAAIGPMQFSLFYFSANEERVENTSTGDVYRLLLDGARFADEHGFVAVWTPERHFHAFGGLYPNPAVCGAAVAAITKHVQIRAGSVVLPLHHPARVAEDWAVVDNLSGGRAAISVASGWQPNDFVLRPENYRNAKAAMFRDLEIVKRLWRGEPVEFPGATGESVSVRTLPRPVQPELPVWVTTAGNIETYRQAGAIGANVLTHLLGQSIEELAPKIAAYRQARAEAGFNPATGVVSLMLHTYVGDDEAAVRETVRQPLKQYLGSSLNLLKQYAWAFPAFTRPTGETGGGDELASLTEKEREAMLEHAFARYYETSGLFGSPARCAEMAARLQTIGVNEIACLIDFGVPTDAALAALVPLAEVKRIFEQAPSLVASNAPADEDFSFAAQMRAHRVTHLQCTPSMARMLLADDDSRAALAGLRQMMVGGEALPPTLAAELRRAVGGRVTNMYGPTETTVWSSTHDLTDEPGATPIGRPIANTQLYVLDRFGNPTPPGVAGELFIAGDGVVRGYLHRAELTAERFVADPFAKTIAARMYRTGDLARWRDDGVLEFLGRTDHQVKIRGYRIELGEIESRLAQHESIGEHVVVVREDVPGDPRIVAYYSAKAPVHEEALREFLRAALPEYMTPSHFVALDALPHTPNGKIDRRALPAPQSTGSTTGSAPATIVAATNDVESMLVGLWKQTLGRNEIGVTDNFFDLGGHSLLVVRLHRQLREMVDRPVSLTDLYRFPTVRSLAEFLAVAEQPSESLQRSTDRGQKRREALLRRRSPAPNA